MCSSDLDAEAVAAALRPVLGWTLGQRRRALWIGSALPVAALAVALWLALLPGSPPPPWDFQGEVTDRITRMAIPGVEVDILAGNQVQASALTNAEGRFDLQLRQPEPKTINVRFRKDGYQAEEPLNIPTGKPWSQDMAKAD